MITGLISLINYRVDLFGVAREEAPTPAQRATPNKSNLCKHQDLQKPLLVTLHTKS
jgi:hypothetical protein